MRIASTCILICTLFTLVSQAGPVELPAKLLRVEGDLFVIETSPGETTTIGRDTIKAVRVHNGQSELKLLNDVVVILSNQPGKVDTEWKQLTVRKPKPIRRRTTTLNVSRTVPKKKNGVSPNEMAAYARTLNDLVQRARPGMTSTRDAGDVRTVAFLARALTKAAASRWQRYRGDDEEVEVISRSNSRRCTECLASFCCAQASGIQSRPGNSVFTFRDSNVAVRPAVNLRKSSRQ